MLLEIFPTARLIFDYQTVIISRNVYKPRMLIVIKMNIIKTAYRALVFPAIVAGVMVLSLEARAEEYHAPSFETAAPEPAQRPIRTSYFFLLKQKDNPADAAPLKPEETLKDNAGCLDARCNAAGRNGASYHNLSSINAGYAPIEVLAMNTERGSLKINPVMKEAASIIDKLFAGKDLKGKYLCGRIYRVLKFSAKFNSKINNEKISVSYSDGGINAKITLFQKKF